MNSHMKSFAYSDSTQGICSEANLQKEMGDKDWLSQLDAFFSRKGIVAKLLDRMIPEQRAKTMEEKRLHKEEEKLRVSRAQACARLLAKHQVARRSTEMETEI